MSKVLNAMNSVNPSGMTWNGALSNSTVGFGKYSDCLAYWIKAGTYRNRSQSDVNHDMACIFADDVETAIKIVFGLRLISRNVKQLKTDDVQAGFGQRDEFFKAIKFMADFYPKELYANLHLIPIVGSWKDIFSEEILSTVSHDKLIDLIKEGLTSSREQELISKYLPQIRSKSKVRSKRDGVRVEFARKVAKSLNISEKEYRLFKAGGKAHVWQQQMSANEWDQIDFNTIPGKAMTNHISQVGKQDRKTVFERHGLLDSLKTWALSKENINFTGYPYDLTKAAAKSKNIVQDIVLDKQFNTLLKQFEGHSLGNVLVACDTSGSMSWEVNDGVTALDVCLSLGLVFSALNLGFFKDSIVSFSNHSTLCKLSGDFKSRFNQIMGLNAMGSTNFQSVIDLIVRTRKQHPEIPVNEYPETLLVVSDMQFNPVSGNAETNYQRAVKELAAVGLGEMRIIWWFVNGAGKDFPSTMTDKGVYMVGGFDPAMLKVLIGQKAEEPTKKDVSKAESVVKSEATPLDGLMKFLNQEIFTLVKI